MFLWTPLRVLFTPFIDNRAAGSASLEDLPRINLRAAATKRAMFHERSNDKRSSEARVYGAGRKV